MASLEEQQIKTMFQGVSRQPDSVRLSGQVEEANNVLLSVVSGGFEKRMGTEHVAAISGIGASDTPATYAYQRDTNEQYYMFVNDGDLYVYDLSGTQKTVSVDDGTRQFAFQADSTTLAVISTHNINYPTSETQIDLTMADLAGGLTVKVEGSSTGAFGGEEVTIATITANGTTTVTIYPYIRTEVTVVGTGTFTLTGTFEDTTYLVNTTDPENGFSFTTLLDTTVVANKSVLTAMDATVGSATIYGPARSFADLPRSGEDVPSYLSGFDTGATANKWDSTDTGCTNGDIWKVQDSANPEGYYYAQLDSTGTVWTWEETADPTGANAFDLTTMPHFVTRNSDGTFTFKRGTFNDRGVGDTTITPDPDFIGSAITAITFHRNRLWLCADETAYASQAGDYFNFWPDEAGNVGDADPFGRTASASQVSLIKHAVPFRKSLFVTSDRNQFDLSSGNSTVLTPNNAVIDLSTSYEIETKASPLTIADELLLPASSGNNSTLFEYQYDDDALAATAVDSAIHVFGYLPANMIKLTGDSVTSTVWALSSDDRDALYVYRFYFDGEKKAQRAWSKWTMRSGSHIHSMDFINGYLYIIVRRPDNTTYMERVLVDVVNGPNSHSTPVLADQWTTITGSYNSGTDLTTFTLPYEHASSSDLVVVLDSGFGSTDEGRQLTPTFTTTTAFTVSGDFSASEVIVGFDFEMLVELSKQYVREADGTTLTNGRLQLKRISFDYEDTGFFQVRVTPSQRTARTFSMTGRVLGDGSNNIGSVPIISGTQRFPVGSKGDTVKIEVLNSTHLPCKITSAFWVGMFNELTRQE